MKMSSSNFPTQTEFGGRDESLYPHFWDMVNEETGCGNL